MHDMVERFLASEDGPTATEYAVMLALIIAVCIWVVVPLGARVSLPFWYIEGVLW